MDWERILAIRWIHANILQQISLIFILRFLTMVFHIQRLYTVEKDQIFICYSTVAAVWRWQRISYLPEKKYFSLLLDIARHMSTFFLILWPFKGPRVMYAMPPCKLRGFPAEYIYYYVFLMILTINTEYVSDHHNWPVYVMRTLDVSCNAGNQFFTCYLDKNYRLSLKATKNNSPKLSISLISNKPNFRGTVSQATDTHHSNAEVPNLCSAEP